MGKFNFSNLNRHVMGLGTSGITTADALGAGFERVERNMVIPIVITNNSTTQDLTVLLTPGFEGDTAKGLIKDGTFKGLIGGVNGTEETTASLHASVMEADYVNIRKFLHIVKHSALGLAGIRVRSTNAAQMLTSLRFATFRHLEPEITDQIILATLMDENTVSDKTVTVRSRFMLNKNVTMSATIPRAENATTPTVTIFMLTVGVIQSFDNSIKAVMIDNPEIVDTATQALDLPTINRLAPVANLDPALIAYASSNNIAQLASRINGNTGALMTVSNRSPHNV